MAPFSGLAGSDTDFLSFGNGMSAVFKYLTEEYGDNILVEIYRKMESGTLPAGAMIQSSSDAATVWWPDFFIKYISGRIFKVESQTFISSIPVGQIITIDDTSDAVDCF